MFETLDIFISATSMDSDQNGTISKLELVNFFIKGIQLQCSIVGRKKNQFQRQIIYAFEDIKNYYFDGRDGSKKSPCCASTVFNV